MDINEIPRGQLSTIILTTLLDKDKYGLEIIDEIEKKTFGEVVIKKPSLYSSLNRMEKQDLVSSYWKDSDIGGRRHYYRLTDFGRKQVLQWQNELLSSQTKVSKILSQENTQAKEEVLDNSSKPTILQQENLFDFTKSETVKPATSLPKQAESVDSSKSQDFIQYDLFSPSNFISYPETNQTKKENYALSQEPTVFNFKEMEKKRQEPTETLQTPQVQADQTPVQPKEEPKQPENALREKSAALEKKLVQIKNNFNFESEYEKHIKTTSSYAQTFQSDKNALKNDLFSPYNESDGILHGQSSFSSTFDGDFSMPKKSSFMMQEDTAKQEENNHEHSEQTDFHHSEETNEEEHDDAVLITAKPKEEELPKVKKIAPATLNFKQNKTDMVEKRKAEQAYLESENIIKQKEEKTFIQTEKLKEYFQSKNIAFTSYNKKLSHEEMANEPDKKTDYIKINLFNMWKSLGLFLLMALESAALFLVLNLLGLFQVQTSLWILIALNALAFGWSIYHLIVFLKDKTKTVLKSSIVQNPLWYKLILVLIALVLVYALNLLGGLNEYNYTNYLTTLILPVILVFDYLVIHFVNLFVIQK